MAPVAYLSAFLALSMGAAASAIPVVERSYSEVIPGHGLPSLEKLGVTSAELYETEPDFSEVAQIYARAEEARCGPEDAAYAKVGDVIACYNYLRSLGKQSCAVEGTGILVEVCRTGSAVVRIFSNTQATSSHCFDVATGAQWVLDSCTRPDQSVAGRQYAGGNGNLMVSVSNTGY